MAKTRRNIRKFKVLLQFAALYLVIVAVGFVSIVLAYCLPTGRMQNNVNISVPIFAEEGCDSVLIYGGDQSYRLDNYTDAMMLSIAAYSRNASPVEEAMYNHSRIKSDNTVDSLILTANEGWDNDIIPVSEYSRYWHGYLVLLKPLLMFLTYYDIRELMALVQFFLAAMVIGLMGCKKELHLVVPFFAAWLFMNPLTLSMSMQFNTVFVLTLLTLLACILFSRKLLESAKNAMLLFFTAGCLTSYFDFLTYPLVALGIPAAYLVYSEGKSGGKPKGLFILLVALCISWGCGYVMMWAAKWVLSALITHTDVIGNALDQIKFRSFGTNSGNILVSYGEVLNLNTSTNRAHIIAAAFFALVGVIANTLKKKRTSELLPLFLIALLPFGWYFFTLSHSALHNWFTFREMAITIFSLWTIAMLGFFGKMKESGKTDMNES